MLLVGETFDMVVHVVACVRVEGKFGVLVRSAGKELEKSKYGSSWTMLEQVEYLSLDDWPVRSASFWRHSDRLTLHVLL